ncbi:putative glycolipid-binding domain-containing protein [Trinickia dinghuensis]|uniref:Transcriptional regulator n=1 Tax=Trinickia dinghuensis TaxID=2291023 RepID=A0A3D8K1P8_9BURK|nr:putative glycolipid-binding domain-containing protein [Trinickia dinghuensis]RDU98982.1 transcriptional regulator [Trinickia dinghuensis]
MATAAQWIPESGVGAEHLVLMRDGQSFVAEAVVVGHRFDTPYGVHYRIEIAPDWTVRRVAVALTDGRKLNVFANGTGTWLDEHHQRIPELDGCIDVDLSATPFTNTLPIRRLGLAKGQRQLIRVAYLAIPALTIEPVDQAYTCIEPNRRYLYEGLFRQFQAELSVDPDGLVEDYPSLFRRVV